MKRSNLYTLLSHVASGVAIFVAAGGAMWGFITYYQLSFIAASAAAVIGLVPGLFMLLFAEGFYLLLEILQEKRRQTDLLTKIEAGLQKKGTPSSEDGSDEIISDH